MHCLKSFLFFLILFSVLSCTSKQKEAEQWRGEMQGLAADVRNLLPFVYDAKAFSAPENKATVQAYLQQFAQGAHKINPEMSQGLEGDDPLVLFSVENLQEDLRRADRAFSSGQTEYARSVVKGSLNHCFRCHSVTGEGRSAPWDLSGLNHLKMAPNEKADLLVATRKYDEALGYMEGLLVSPNLMKGSQAEFESLLQRYLALMIRVKNNPKGALEELDKILSKNDTPQYIAEQMIGWRKSLNAWIKEPSSKSKQGPIQLAEERFRQAKKLQRFERDHAGDVEYLRATAILHESLKSLKNPKDQAQAMWMLGNAYEVMDELGSWNLHEAYYEICINKSRQSPIAKKCLNRLEASVMMGYSGSSGTHIPQEESAKLERLKQLIHKQ